MAEIIMNAKNKLLMALTVFLILFVLIGSVSAADDNTTALSQDNDKAINQEEISTGNDDSSLEIKNKEILKTNDENTTLNSPVSGRTFDDIQTAINSASSGDTIELIGEYKGNGKDITINKDNLTIIGTNDATLNAQGQSRVLKITHNGVTLKNIKFTNGFPGSVFIENCRASFINCSFTNNNAEWQGGAVYLTGADGSSFTSCLFNKNNADEGGVVYSYRTNGAYFIDSLFIDNKGSFGGVIMSEDSANNFINCSFMNNNANRRGGVLHDKESSADNFINCSFENNSAKLGGAVVLLSSEKVNFKNCSFVNNSADDYGGAVNIKSASFTDCSFDNNHAPNQGGAAFVKGGDVSFINCSFNNHKGSFQGGAVYVYSDHMSYFLNCSFANNQGAMGGVAYIRADTTSFSGCSFDNNSGSMGGAIFVLKAVANFTDSSFDNNTVDQEGGAVYINESAEGSFNNCSFTHNNANTGGAIYNNDRTLIKYSKFTENNANEGQAIRTEKDMSISDSEFMGNGEYCIEVKLGAKVTLNNVLNDTSLINTIIITILEAKDVVYGNNVSIKVQVNSSTPSPLNKGKVVVNVNDVEYEDDVKDGIATLVIPKLDAGTYNVNVTYVDNNVSKAETPVNFNVTKATAEIVIANNTFNVTALDLISVGASLNPADAGNLTYTSSNSSVVIVENGKIKALSMGTAVITVSCAGNNNYAAAKSKTITVNVSLCNASVSVVNSTLDLYVGNTFAIVAVTTPVGLNVTYVPDDSGVVSVDENGVVTALKNGTGKIIVKVGGDGVATENSTVVTVNVKPKEDLNIKAVADPISIGENLNVVVTGLDKATGNVTVRVDNKTYSGPIVNGTAKVVISGLTKNAIAYVDYDGDMRYNPSNTTLNITVNKIKTTITVKSVIVTYNDNLVISLKDVNGNPVSGVKISVVLGKSITLTTNKNGQVKVSTSGVVPKAYNAKITFSGNDKYANSAKSVKVTVKKATPKLTAKAKKFKRSVKTKKYTVTLKTNTNKVIKNVKLTLKVKGKTYKAKTNSKGKATFKITKLTKKGKYKAKVKFAGNKYYKSKTVKVKITVK